MLETRTEFLVATTDIDELGHVNNARFLDYFERGRMDWYAGVGGFPDPGPSGRLATVVVSITVNYRRECFEGDRLTVITRPHGRGGRSSYVLSQEVRRDDGEVAADARVTSVVMDLDSRRAVTVPDALATHLPAGAPGCRSAGDGPD